MKKILFYFLTFVFIQKIFCMENDERQYFTNLPKEIQLNIANKTSVSVINLRLVCKEINNNMKEKLCCWNFKKENFNSFKEVMRKDWVRELLNKVKFIYFKDSAEDSFEDDEFFSGSSSELEWEKDEFFISNKDFKYILKRANNLKGLYIENIPFLSNYLNCQFPFKDKLKYLSYNYNNSIFLNVPYEEILGFSSFTNLKDLYINSQIFSQATKNTNFLLNLKNLKKIKLFDAPRDYEYRNCFSDILYLLQPLINLEYLKIVFLQEPCFKQLKLLEPLVNLKTLNIIFDDKLEKNFTSVKNEDIDFILNSLRSLERLFIKNVYYKFYINKCNIFNFPSKETLFRAYPKLKAIGGNMICFNASVSKDSSWNYIPSR